MEVKIISNKELLANQVNLKEPGSIKEPGKTDLLEISREGKELAKLKLDNQRLQLIKSRIESNFYNTDEVLSKVAEKIYTELK